MKIDVPFYKQTTGLNCGLMALLMIFHYFNKKVSIKEIEDKMGIKKGKGVYTIQLAIASELCGFETKLYSIESEDDVGFETEFYKNYMDKSLDLDKLKEEAKRVGVKLIKKSLPLKELLNMLSEDCVPLVLIDWNVVKGKKGYHGHFVPLVGYDEKNVFIHNHGFQDTEAFMKVPKKLFDKSRKSQGTDEDILIISKR